MKRVKEQPLPPSAKPILRHDKDERYFWVGVEESLEATNALLPDSFPDAKAHPDDRINFPPNVKQPDLPPVAYHHAVWVKPLWWHQLWFWYVHNRKAYPFTSAGWGEHEGDWECIQTACDREGVPVLVTCSQHGGGTGRMWRATERRDGRMVAYVAVDSHANYFQPGVIAEDRCDGQGREFADYEVRELTQCGFVGWGGRFGNSTGKSRSPRGPAFQGAIWGTPDLFHEKAR